MMDSPLEFENNEEELDQIPLNLSLTKADKNKTIVSSQKEVLLTK